MTLFLRARPSTAEPDSAWSIIPREPSERYPDYLKHVIAEGARYHVISWSNLGRQCSEPRCEINAEPTKARQPRA